MSDNYIEGIADMSNKSVASFLKWVSVSIYTEYHCKTCKSMINVILLYAIPYIFVNTCFVFIFRKMVLFTKPSLEIDLDINY